MDFSDLSDEDLWLQMQDDLYDGLKEEVVEEVNEALGRGYSATDVLAKGLVAGMDIVGIDFRDGILFVPEVLMAANAMKAGMEILRPLLSETGARRMGKVVIGTVKGDIHDIREEPRRDDARGRRVRRHRPRHQQAGREVPRRARGAQPRHPRHVGAAHDHHALHEGGDRRADRQGMREDYIVMVVPDSNV
jgi:hypothetical protein